MNRPLKAGFLELRIGSNMGDHWANFGGDRHHPSRKIIFNVRQQELPHPWLLTDFRFKSTLFQELKLVQSYQLVQSSKTCHASSPQRQIVRRRHRSSEAKHRIVNGEQFRREQSKEAFHRYREEPRIKQRGESNSFSSLL